MQALRRAALVRSGQFKVSPLRTVTTTRFVKYKKETTPSSTTGDAKKVISKPKIIKDEATSVKEELPLNNLEVDPAAALDAGTSYFPVSESFDNPIEGSEGHNWSVSFHGLSTQPFSKDIADVLMQPVNPEDIEIKPDGLIYLPEIKYRRILNRAFGPGGWGLAPRSEHSISPKNISREYALVCHGRFISQARGEQDFFDVSGLPTASEGCKSNALMRCCKDLGVASELWDPVFIRKFKRKYCVEVWAEHVTTKRKKKLWRKKDDTLDYPYKETGMA
ncbi:mitochondrial genome maintenance MGM101-domain-containing protein [Radiomyces spectabilis]|uniref:mitochondrial genome maintenance MGM101-domain-containing protein n=1 Tax=Radiomyces spectabilis TaxID=64574 RepID=UPI00221FA9BB|nr:mitochondrial genome maintenance MGM101-domain-containing protein [Radiomyces spectabilis]KAI8374748.1 mitochondrial genome maintenance MGM101-domain-containing protein [Radiomyces spectabilis]